MYTLHFYMNTHKIVFSKREHGQYKRSTNLQLMTLRQMYRIQKHLLMYQILQNPQYQSLQYLYFRMKKLLQQINNNLSYKLVYPRSIDRSLKLRDIYYRENLRLAAEPKPELCEVFEPNENDILNIKIGTLTFKWPKL